jgi:hypothetical protein
MRAEESPMRLTERLFRRRARRRQRGSASGRPERPGIPFGDADDQAHYACVCGHGFEAVVTASVRCPRCGTEQPW